MPGWPSPAERRALDAFPEQIDAQESVALERWLTVRAMEHERPKALFTLAAEQLHARRITRPSVDQLVRLIGSARERARQATFDALADQLGDAGRRAHLDRLLTTRADGMTWIEWLRTPARETSPIEIVRQLEKFTYLRELGAEQIDLSMLPPGRVRMLAGEGKRRPACSSAPSSKTSGRTTGPPNARGRELAFRSGKPHGTRERVPLSPPGSNRNPASGSGSPLRHRKSIRTRPGRSTTATAAAEPPRRRSPRMPLLPDHKAVTGGLSHGLSRRGAGAPEGWQSG